ncbi:MAG: hypothetical protein JWM31_751 [Solirubrobacterales bacterium]|nr:hypothetical protein [Solirubrobacterales bacterium]
MNTVPQTFTLDAVERRAIRDAVATTATALGDVTLAIDHGRRDEALALLAEFELGIAVLDAIGWSDVPEAPDEQPVEPVEPLRQYADDHLEGLVEVWEAEAEMRRDPSTVGIAGPADALERTAVLVSVLSRVLATLDDREEI